MPFLSISIHFGMVLPIRIGREVHCLPYGRIHPGQRISLKNEAISFYGVNHMSLNMGIDRLLPTCKYQLRVKIDPHDFSL